MPAGTLDKTRAEVIEELPNATFRLKLEDGNTVIGYLGGKLKTRKIAVKLGDKVEVVLDPYGGVGTNRITWRV